MIGTAKMVDAVLPAFHKLAEDVFRQFKILSLVSSTDLNYLRTARPFCIIFNAVHFYF